MADVRVRLRPDQQITVDCLAGAAGALSARTTATTAELARVKKHAEDFLAIPLVQALSTEDL